MRTAASAKKPHAMTLRWTSAVLYPQAECDACEWTHTPSRFTRENAKTHARTHPGHAVTVDVVKRSQYWVETQ